MKSNHIKKAANGFIYSGKNKIRDGRRFYEVSSSWGLRTESPARNSLCCHRGDQETDFKAVFHLKLIKK